MLRPTVYLPSHLARMLAPPRSERPVAARNPSSPAGPAAVKVEPAVPVAAE